MSATGLSIIFGMLFSVVYLLLVVSYRLSKLDATLRNFKPVQVQPVINFNARSDKAAPVESDGGHPD